MTIVCMSSQGMFPMCMFCVAPMGTPSTFLLIHFRSTLQVPTASILVTWLIAKEDGAPVCTFFHAL